MEIVTDLNGENHIRRRIYHIDGMIYDVWGDRSEDHLSIYVEAVVPDGQYRYERHDHRVIRSDPASDILHPMYTDLTWDEFMENPLPQLMMAMMRQEED